MHWSPARFAWLLGWLFGWLAIVGGCEAEPSLGPGSADCDNLDESHCLFPFPSNRFITQTAAGPRVTFPVGAMPVSTAGVPVDVKPYAEHDGFSTVGPIMFDVAGATLTGVATKADIDVSLSATSKTVLLDADTGERWPHFAEFDYLAANAEPVITIRIARPLAYGHRYIVAVRGLVDKDGNTIAATRGFASLRDGNGTDVAGIESRRAQFESAIFPVLDKAGIVRGDLQLAWDFSTLSEHSATHLLLAMRDQLLAAIGTQGPEYTITQVDTPATGPIAKILTGTAKIPSFLTAPDANGIPHIGLDASGEPVIQGMVDTPFTLQIPQSALTSAKRSAVVQYGHGFLGTMDEATSGWLQTWADQENFLILATDMVGFNTDAGLVWAKQIPNDISIAPLLGDWPHQGIMNHLALQRMMKGRFLADTDARYTNAGTPFYDPARLYYHGNSQGGTIGNIVIATSVDVTRAVLGVPGTAFSYLVSRANEWQLFATEISSRYQGSRDLSAIMGVLQLAFDRIEPSNYAARVTDNPFPDTPSHQVLLHAGLGDAQVNNDVSQLLARIVGAKLVQPAVRPVWGLDSLAAPFSGHNAYVEFDFGVPLDQTGNRPEATETDTHERPRKSPQAQAQAWQFLETGVVVQTCDGSCNPD